MSTTDFGKLTVQQLKIELSRRGSVVSGRKENLVERLIAYERNNNFSGSPVILPEVIITDWPVAGFQQLTREHQLKIPQLTQQHVDSYFKYRMVMDNESAGDLKAITKGRLLFDSNRVEACSTTNTDESCYFSGMVRAAMKKKVSYSYRLALKSDSAEVINSHCECPAGKGPHGTCKHLAAVCMMLIDFIKTGKIAVDRTCTESLQTFHRPKSRYQGSPIKVENLAGKSSVPLGDPRPPKYRNQPGYNDYVQNLVINYCGNHSKDLAMRYNYVKADVHAASLDHDYLLLPLNEQLVENSNTVDMMDVQKIEKKTRHQAQSKLWHSERSTRITASRFGEVIRMTARRNKTKLCQSLYENKMLTNPAVNHGRLYESVAITQYEETFKKNVKKCGLFVLPSVPYLGASPDGMTADGVIIEVKCPFSGSNMEITPSKYFPFLGMRGGHMILKETHKYYAQIQGQLHISQKKECDFIVWTSVDFFALRINYNETFCKHSLIPKLHLFYSKYYRKFVASKL